MAAPSWAIVGTRLSAADALTGWDAGNISGDDSPVQGSSAIGQKISAATAGFGYTHGSTFDVSGTNRRCVYLWMNCLSGIATQASGGLRMRVGNDNANYRLYYVAGSDNYTGGWRKRVAVGGDPCLCRSLVAVGGRDRSRRACRGAVARSGRGSSW